MRGVDGFHGPTTDVDFAVGSIWGTRSFQVNSNQKLTGVTFMDYEYADGENVAKCELCEIDRELHAMESEAVNNTREANALLEKLNSPTRLPDFKPVAKIKDMSECGHGFWAYFDKGDGFSGPHTVSGVVEGYGEVVVGEKGFRASKAKIVALTEPKSLDKSYGITYNVILLVLAGITVLTLLLNLLLTENPSYASFFPAMLISILLFSSVKTYKDIRQRRAAQKLVRKIEENPTIGDIIDVAHFIKSRMPNPYILDVAIRASTSLNFEQVKKNYPSARVYSSRAEMLAAYPTLGEQNAKWSKLVSN